MSSAIGGIGGSSSMMMQGMGRMQRPDASKMAEALFSKLDTGGKGYIEQADLQTAFQQVPTANSGSAEEVFATLDGDRDGKVTRQEMSDSLRKLSEALDEQFNSLRMSSAMSGMGGNGAGLTAADLNLRAGRHRQFRQPARRQAYPPARQLRSGRCRQRRQDQPQGNPGLQAVEPEHRRGHETDHESGPGLRPRRGACRQHRPVRHRLIDACLGRTP